MTQPHAFRAGEPAGRTALITGAGSGIGAAVARMLGAAGVRCALIGRRPEPLESVALGISGGEGDDGEALAIPCDVTRADQVAAAVKMATSALGPIEIVVHAAGQGHSGTLARVTDDDIDAVIDLNVRSAWHIACATLPAMRAAKFGRIVMIASTAALRGYRYTALYTASKHALGGLVRSLASECLADGVTVNAVCPGFVDTALVDRSVDEIATKTGRDAADVKAALAAQNPMGRLIHPDEVAASVLWLLGDGGAAVSGQSIVIDGG